MTADDELLTPDQARAALRRLAAERDRIAEEEPVAVVKALRVGVRQVEIAADLGRTREHVRRIARANGLPAS